MNFKRLAAFGTSLLLSISSLLVFAPSVHAATKTWDGGGDGIHFTDGNNWAPNGTPGSLDDVVFNTDGLTTDTTLNNDMVSGQFGSITFEGTNPNHGYVLTGNSLTMNGNITDNASRASDIQLDLILGSNITITSTSDPDDDWALGIGEADGTNTLDLGGFTLTVAGSDAIILSSIIHGSGDVHINGSSDQLYFLDGANDFTGDVVVNHGSLIIRDTTALGTSGGDTTVNNDAELDVCISGSPTVAEPITFNSTGQSGVGILGVSDCDGGTVNNVTLSGAINLQKDLTFYTFVNASLTLTGAISGSHTMSVVKPSSLDYALTVNINSSNNTSLTPNGVLTKDGLTVSIAANDSQPAQAVTIADDQTYVIDGTRGAITVNNGGTLKGKGTVGTINVASGGTVAPGQSPGILNSGNVTFVSGSTYAFEVGGAADGEYDQINVTGTVTLGNGTLNVSRYNDFKPVAGQTYTIIKNDAADAVTGTFNNLAEGAEVTVDGYVLGISYVGGDGNDVVLTVKTVPASPNTGFQLLAQNPIATFTITTALAGSLYVLSRKVRRLVR